MYLHRMLRDNGIVCGIVHIQRRLITRFIFSCVVTVRWKARYSFRPFQTQSILCSMYVSTRIHTPTRYNERRQWFNVISVTSILSLVSVISFDDIIFIFAVANRRGRERHSDFSRGRYFRTPDNVPYVNYVIDNDNLLHFYYVKVFRDTNESVVVNSSRFQGRTLLRYSDNTTIF